MKEFIKVSKLGYLIEVDSAGTYGGHAGDLPDSRMRAHALRRGYNLTHRSRQIRIDDFDEYDMIIDCIDTISAKLDIICEAHRLHIPLISSMGAGNRLDPLQIKVGDLFETSYDPLAKVMRRELKKRNIRNVKVVYSKEEVKKPLEEERDDQSGKPVPGSLAFVPSVAGLILAGEVIRELAAGMKE